MIKYLPSWTIAALALIALAPERTVLAQDCNIQKIIVLIDSQRLEAIPKEAKCIARTRRITIRLISVSDEVDIALGAVTTTGKSTGEEDDWLNGSNSRKSDQIVLTVPARTPLGDYQFSIDVPGVGELDPRVRVVEELSLLQALQDRDLEDVDEYALDLLIEPD